ncbi:glycosyltransferase family 2 protein [Gephyromycinifex aptenodytis]|uniref:glycosyltransferase family 2 protein n=1 Tax=Gephyromycinifex aptenodytis TaxID=2716227 RepID=UPI00144651B4|nr:glycosyltransferase family 2 protein [Gephyromycinifex aptenodytis]
MSDLVSVLVPAYKRADTILDAVRSALQQTYDNLEVIVVDDHSQDGTDRVLTAIQDPRLRVLSHAQNLGGNAARRTAIESSSGKYLAFLDADDLWLPTKLAAQVQSLQAAGPQAGLCYTWYDLRYPDGRLVPGRTPRAEGLRIPALYQGNFIGTFSCVLVRREVIDAVGGPDPTLPSCQDWEFYLRVNDRFAITCVPQVLVHYWRDDSDATRISASASKVAAGHRELYSRIGARLNTLPAPASSRGRRYFMETFANHGDLTGLAKLACDVPLSRHGLADLRFTARMFARAARKSARSRTAHH